MGIWERRKSLLATDSCFAYKYVSQEVVMCCPEAPRSRLRNTETLLGGLIRVFNQTHESANWLGAEFH